MKLSITLLPLLGLAALTTSSCVVAPVGPDAYVAAPGPIVGVGVGVAPIGIGVWDVLPPAYYGDYYCYGGRYYYGGRYEPGHFHWHGHDYDHRYFHNGHYMYGGRWDHRHR